MAKKKTKQFEYVISDDKAVLTKYIASPQTRKIIIPATIEDKPVESFDGGLIDYKGCNLWERIKRKKL